MTVGSGGTGNGSVNVTVAANTGTAQRTGSVTIAGQTFSVTQAGAPCTFGIAPTNRDVTAAGESVAVTVTAGSTCAWSTTSNAAWLSVGSGGTGDGSVDVIVAANTGTAQRTGTVTIADQTLSVTQSGVPTCTYALTPTNRAAPAAGETVAVAVTAGSTCAWDATSNNAWLTIGSGGTGTGDGTVNVVVAANTSATQRIGTVTIAGQTFTVTQAGVPTCSYALTPAMRTSPTAGETVTVTLTTGSHVCVDRGEQRVLVDAGLERKRHGQRNVSVVVAANTGTAQRSGTVTIGGQLFTVTQAGTTGCTMRSTDGENVSCDGRDIRGFRDHGQRVQLVNDCQFAVAWPQPDGRHGERNHHRNGRRQLGDDASDRDHDDRRADADCHPEWCRLFLLGDTDERQCAGCRMTGTFAVVTTSTCTWSVTGIPSWMTVTPTSRTGTAA